MSDSDIYDALKCDYVIESEFNQKYGNINTKNIDLSIFHLNIRSLNANQSQLLELPPVL